MAKELPPTPVPPYNHIGVQLDVGVPDGVALGLIVKPKWYWLAVGASGTYNGLAPGVRGSLKLDPIRFPIRLTLTGELGYSFMGNASKWVGEDTPEISYTYANVHPGVELGSNNGFSFFVHAGPTWMNVNTSRFQQTFIKSNDVWISDPRGNVFLFPTVKFGFSLLFL